MKVNIQVTVTLGKIDEQDTKEFEKEDGKAMIPYLMDIIQERLRDSWQYNAIVTSVKTKIVKS